VDDCRFDLDRLASGPQRGVGDAQRRVGVFGFRCEGVVGSRGLWVRGRDNVNQPQRHIPIDSSSTAQSAAVIAASEPSMPTTTGDDAWRVMASCRSALPIASSWLCEGRVEGGGADEWRCPWR
jgi:hypothetical protein